MMLYLLDTNIVSYAIKPQYLALRDRIERELLKRSLAISAITRAELRVGQALMQLDDKRISTIDDTLSTLPTLAWTAQAADIYGKIDSVLIKTGRQIGMADAMIAAHALAENLTLVTHNVRHFERIDGLKIEDWTV